MRNGETHFEQVSIEVAETVCRQAAALAEGLKKKPALVPAPGRPTVEELFEATGE